MDLVFNLYPTEGEAQMGSPGSGGTAFWIGIMLETPGWWQCYAVTCPHCLIGQDHFFARVNLSEGGTEVLRLDSWIRHPDGDEVAVCAADPHPGVKFAAIGREWFGTRDILEKYGITVGDDVFMVGRFRGFEGEHQNIPTMRFGNISAIPSEPLLINGHRQSSYLVEMKSLPGYSGSPVLVFQVDAIERDPDSSRWSIRHGLTGPYLLGIDWCHINDREPVLNQADGLPVAEGSYVRSNSGIAGVIPVEKLLELIDSNELKTSRRLEDESIRAKKLSPNDN